MQDAFHTFMQFYSLHQQMASSLHFRTAKSSKAHQPCMHLLIYGVFQLHIQFWDCMRNVFLKRYNASKQVRRTRDMAESGIVQFLGVNGISIEYFGIERSLAKQVYKRSIL